MNSFSDIKELISAIHRERELLNEMFIKRKTLSYKYDLALEMVDSKDDRIKYLIDHSVIVLDGDFLRIDDLFLQFFEQVLEVNEEINTSYINENIQEIKQNINYYFTESDETRKYNYLRLIKNTFIKIGNVALRSVIDLKRNVETTFKNEPNYKVKKIKLVDLDKKRVAIMNLIKQAEKLILKDEQTFFKSALDEELRKIICQVELQLDKCTHNLIEIEKQIINFLNKISYQSEVIEKLQKIKYLKDQFTIETNTNINSVLAQNNLVIFEPNLIYHLKLSIEHLQNNDHAYASIVKIAKNVQSGRILKQPLADKISKEYLETQIEEEIQDNLEDVKNSFVASGNNLFEFLLGYTFAKEISFEERVTIYCQLISDYENNFEIRDTFETIKGIEFAIVYPKKP